MSIFISSNFIDSIIIFLKEDMYVLLHISGKRVKCWLHGSWLLLYAIISPAPISPCFCVFLKKALEEWVAKRKVLKK